MPALSCQGPFSADVRWSRIFLRHGHFKPIPWLRADVIFLDAGLLQAKVSQSTEKHSHVPCHQESMCVCDFMPQILYKTTPSSNIPKAIILHHFCISLYISTLKPSNYEEIRSNTDPSSRSHGLL